MTLKSDSIYAIYRGMARTYNANRPIAHREYAYGNDIELAGGAAIIRRRILLFERDADIATRERETTDKIVVLCGDYSIEDIGDFSWLLQIPEVKP